VILGEESSPVGGEGNSGSGEKDIVHSSLYEIFIDGLMQPTVPEKTDISYQASVGIG
jgi:hypothetical protein